MVSKEEMEPSSWCIYHTKSSQKQIRGEKIMGLQSRGEIVFTKKKLIEQLIAYF
jgi:hypothetical protein